MGTGAPVGLDRGYDGSSATVAPLWESSHIEL